MITTQKADVAVLRSRAAQLIREHGWVQDWEGDHDVGYCLIGALHEARGSVDPYAVDSAIADIARELAEKGCLPGMSAGVILTEFNDAPQRTIDDVLEALEPERNH